jgi:hypothetical protein
MTWAGGDSLMAIGNQAIKVKHSPASCRNSRIPFSTTHRRAELVPDFSYKPGPDNPVRTTFASTARETTLSPIISLAPLAGRGTG